MAKRMKPPAPEATMPKARLSAVIKTARDIMRKDAGLNGDLDRIPQLSWILFLKCFDDLEKRREVTEKRYRPAIEGPHRWRDWAADPNRGATGPDLLKLVNDDLLPYLRELSGGDGNEQRDVLAAVFKETHNRMLSGYLLRDVVNLVHQLDFNAQDDIHVLAHLYESMLREMRDAAGDSGEFYTPRPVIRFIVQQVDPRLGESVLDPAAGTGGFLVETFEHLKPKVKTVEQRRRLQSGTLFGIEKKPMPYLLGMMNLLLHGVENPGLRRENALQHPVKSIPEAARHDAIVTNPPFGGEEEVAIQSNFPEGTRTSETALLFMQFIMKSLKERGRCGMIVPNGTLFGDGVCARIKQELLTNFNLHTIVRLPNGVFEPYTPIPTNLLFFDRPGPTRETWFYEVPPPEGRKKYSKTLPMRFEEFAPCHAWWGGRERKGREESERAWRVAASEVVKTDAEGRATVNLDLKNPRQKEDLAHRPPEEIVRELLAKQPAWMAILSEVERPEKGTGRWPERVLGDLLHEVVEDFTVDPIGTYRSAGILSYGRGLFEKRSFSGSETRYPRLKRLRAGQFVYSRLFAWEGAFAIVPPEFDGACVSHEFPTFWVDSLAEPQWVLLCVTRRPFWESLVGNALGQRRRRVHPQEILQRHIPLPPLPQQARIVSVMQRLDLARRLHEQSLNLLDGLRVSVLTREFCPGNEPEG